MNPTPGYFTVAYLRELLNRKKAKQMSSLYTSMVFGFLVSFGVSVVNTRILGPRIYGDLKFLQNIIAIFVTCLTFGYFMTGSMLLAQDRNKPIKRDLFGSLLFIAASLSAVLIAGLFVFSFFEEDIFKNDLGRAIRVFSPFAFVFLYQECVEKMLIGDNRIYELSLLNIVPQTLYLAGAVAFNYFVDLTLFSALGLQIAALLGVLAAVCLSLKVGFKDIRRNVSYVLKENRVFGLHVYIGVLASVVSGQLASVWIAYYMENTYVGFFSLAISLTLPLAMIPNAVSSTFFKDYANNPSIPRNVLLFTTLASMAALLVFVLIIDRLILFVYSERFSAVIPIVYFVAVGSVLHGFGDLYNQFLGAHGQGKAMRNGSIAVGIINVFGYYLFVKHFGIMGAAVVKLASSLFYLIFRSYPYYRLVSKYRGTGDAQGR